MELMVGQWLAVCAAYQNDGTYGWAMACCTCSLPDRACVWLYLQPTRLMELMVGQWPAVLAAYQNDGLYGWAMACCFLQSTRMMELIVCNCLLYLQPTRMMELLVGQWLAVLEAYQNDGTYGWAMTCCTCSLPE